MTAHNKMYLYFTVQYKQTYQWGFLCVVPFVNPPVDVSVLEGGVATLDCNPNGFPTPTIQWNFNDIEILNGGRYSINEQGVLNISNVGLDDIGIYICNATSSIGYANGSISLKVQG